MRDIKFRGKRLDNGEWAYGDLTHYEDQVWIGMDDGRPEHEVDPSTVGEFTGITDLNNKEVYEGDIVCRYEQEEGDTLAFQIVFKDLAFMGIKEGTPFIIPHDTLYGGFGVRVIGNIHEHPHLIEKP
jgi:uncharacterized phage protein (TIGR01671 family)